MIRGRWANEQVEVLGCAGQAMERDGITPDNQELGSCVSELDEEVSKVLGQVDHDSGVSRGTNT